ncbi:MAG: hypothetical protein RR603_00225 [Kurthia sp.]|uniref:Lipoprotein n=1 Tax=Kurthia zopfii TaxID=1650 RepID=A0A2U3AF42_9BACL|nr:hypothetical protein [Kurthia zopfii]PWI23159.1 hypothetical protein DF281_03800 [Kurthia zopfii]TDR41339.1 hypothetical protein DFR61_10632 [Kurthia zopfii]STX09844.1 Uncharacterised protein [Kurthia zopfii]VEI07246.1 Uncharacterised protein [Kurthia zopfii]GEK29981.1 hypothetical protein KZO01_02900 [Kurthia zopfii]
MKKMLVAILVIALFTMTACSNDTAKIEKVDQAPAKVQKLMDGFMKDEVSGGYYLLNNDKAEYYLYVQGDRRDRSMLATDIKDAELSLKGKDVTITVKTERVNVQGSKNRDVLYKVTLPKKTDTIKLIVDGKEGSFKRVFY